MMKLDMSMLDSHRTSRATAEASAEAAGLGMGLGSLSQASFPLPQVQQVLPAPWLYRSLACSQRSGTPFCDLLLTGFSDLMQLDSFEREVMEYVKPNHGTTTLGFIFKGGVIIAVDSRASMGSYICALLASLLPSRFPRAALLLQTDDYLAVEIAISFALRSPKPRRR